MPTNQWLRLSQRRPAGFAIGLAESIGRAAIHADDMLQHGGGARAGAHAAAVNLNRAPDFLAQVQPTHVARHVVNLSNQGPGVEQCLQAGARQICGDTQPLLLSHGYHRSGG